MKTSNQLATELVRYAEDKMEKTMKEWAHGTLHSGSKEGPKVTDQRQAIAIGLNQERKAGEHAPTKHVHPHELAKSLYARKV